MMQEYATKYGTRHRLTLPLTVLLGIFLVTFYFAIENRIVKLGSLNRIENTFSSIFVVSHLMDSIQKERGLSVGFTVSKGERFARALQEQYRVTNKRIESFERQFENHLNAYDEQMRIRFEGIKYKLRKIESIRKKVSTLRISYRHVIDFYTSIDREIMHLFALIVEYSKDPKLTKLLLGLNSLEGLKEKAGLIRATGTAILSCNEHMTSQCMDRIPSFYKYFIHLQGEEKVFKDYAEYFTVDSAYRKRIDDVLLGRSDEKIERYLEFERSLTDETKSLPSYIDSQTWFDLATYRIDRIDDIVQEYLRYIERFMQENRRQTFVGFVLYFLFGIIALGLFVFMLLTIMDILKREQELKKLVDEHVIVSVTDLSGRITDVSSAFASISGYSKEELIGKPHSIVRHPDMPKSLFESLWEKLHDNETWRGEIKNRRKGGESYWVDAVISPMYDKKGRKIGYSAVRHDITDKKRYEALSEILEERVQEEIEKNKRQQVMLLHQSRLAQMGEMISMIAHQWRQPLNIVSAVCSTLQVKVSKDNVEKEDIERFVARIVTQVRYLNETIEDFRRFFRPDKERKTTTYEKVVKSAIEIIGLSLEEKHITVTTECKDDTRLHTYENELKQVLLNLIKNAEDAILEREVRNGHIEIVCEKNKLVVKDNAGGIPEEIIDRIFDPYFSTKTQKEGTGLGLYMSKTIIEEHCGGKLSVHNDEEGAVFVIELPMENEE